MSLSPGLRLGPYEILGPIGAGGMEEVYRAHDAKLHRDVAIKVLPKLFAADPDRVMRFEREAQTLAALNHPNIAQVFGVIEAPPALVELVEGRGLVDMIGRLPLDEALAIARQMVEGLEAAHEPGSSVSAPNHGRRMGAWSPVRCSTAAAARASRPCGRCRPAAFGSSTCRRRPITFSFAVAGWPPDSRRYLFASGKGLVVVDAASGTWSPFAAPEDAIRYRLSYDGRTLLSERDTLDADIWLIDFSRQ
jgi:hypothetical protein